MPEPPPSDPELRETLGLDDQVRIHRINVSGRGASTRILPPATQVAGGEVVQFVVLDQRVHRIRFVRDSLGPEALRFLEETDQSESPLLVEQGSRFVLSFAGAPEGRYPFVIDGHGEPVSGLITVRNP